MKDTSGYWIELARGHYIPKGFVEVSRYRFDSQKHLISKEIKVQENSYDVAPRGAVRERVRVAAEPNINVLRQALDSFEQVWAEIDCVLEFGIDKDVIFLLDFIRLNAGTDISSSLADSGVISKGKAHGKLIRINDKEHITQSENWHAKNALDPTAKQYDGCIIAAKRPFISLMRYLNKNPNHGAVGFVFEEISLLSHFSIQLREKGIPAIWCDAAHIHECTGALVNIDAVTPNLSNSKRLTVLLDGNTARER
jgi:phosphohistidine swiveling domain-containing protein